MKLRAILLLLALVVTLVAVKSEEVEVLQWEHEETTVTFETVEGGEQAEFLELGAIKKLPIKALRKKLSERGVECRGCAEKEDFVSLFHAKQTLPVLPIGTNSAPPKNKSPESIESNKKKTETEEQGEGEAVPHAQTPEEKAKADKELDELLDKLGGQGFGRPNVFRPEDFEGLTQDEMKNRFEQESRKNRVRDRAGKKKSETGKADKGKKKSETDKSDRGDKEDNSKADNNKADKGEKKKGAFKQRGGYPARPKSKGKGKSDKEKEEKGEKEKGSAGEKDKDKKKKAKSPFKTRVPGGSKPNSKSNGNSGGSGGGGGKKATGKRKTGAKYTRKERTGPRPEEMEFEGDIFEEPELSEIFDENESVYDGLDDILNEGFGDNVEKKETEKEPEKKEKAREEVQLGEGWVKGENEDIIEL